MKIGLITFHNSNNYGAVLQTLSVQNTVKKLGYDIEIIDYICPKKKNWYKSFKVAKHPVRMIENMINFPYLVVKNKKFKLFQEQYYQLIKNSFEGIEALRGIDTRYDVFITGSDQVWNPLNTGFDKAYFLDFVTDNKRKISYAASFGISQIPIEYHEEYKRLLGNIKGLSVREKRGQEIIKELIDRDSHVVLDPTLLLDKVEWTTFSKEIENQGEPYVLLYTVNKSKQCNRYAQKLAKQLGCKVIKICSLGLDYLGKSKTVIASPEEYVGLFKNATFVVTNSFHGLAFSINLNKEFYIFLGKNINSHSRMENLIQLCHLESRIINEDSIVMLPEVKIDYEKVDNILEKERDNSIQFLRQALEVATR